MKYIIYIGILFLGISCSESAEILQRGDLLFQVTKSSDMGSAITEATGRAEAINFTHVAIYLGSDEEKEVLEATSEGGVSRCTLAEFEKKSAQRNGKPIIVAKRLRDTCNLELGVQKALALEGKAYDFSFRAGNDRYYCSELVWESYRQTNGEPIFEARPMNFRAADGTMPQFWVDLFERLGEKIPEGESGTNPQDLSNEASLKEVKRWF